MRGRAVHKNHVAQFHIFMTGGTGIINAHFRAIINDGIYHLFLGINCGFAGVAVNFHHNLLVAAGIDIPPISRNQRRFQGFDDYVLRQIARLADFIKCYKEFAFH